jgi:hypothetical protein
VEQHYCIPPWLLLWQERRNRRWSTPGRNVDVMHGSRNLLRCHSLVKAVWIKSTFLHLQRHYFLKRKMSYEKRMSKPCEVKRLSPPPPLFHSSYTQTRSLYKRTSVIAVLPSGRHIESGPGCRPTLPRGNIACNRDNSLCHSPPPRIQTRMFQNGS